MHLRLLALCVAADSLANGSPSIRPNDTIPGYLGKYGIAVEEHWVTTEDGYILEIFRMPRPGAPVLLLQHGILCSSWHWLVNSPSIAPGIQLHNAGYDIWMTNTRGNTYSRNHTTLDPGLNKSGKKFWNFTFAEMGRFDVPANIKYILAHTGKADLTFIGWSQGTSQFFVAMTDEKVKPYVDRAVNLFVAISPVTWMKYQSSKLLTVLTKLHSDVVWDTLFPYGFLEYQVDGAEHALCVLTRGAICHVSVDIIAGRSPLDTNAAITNFTAHFPGGVSAKELRHYSQLIRDGAFRDFDYGKQGNLKQYNQATPPSFDMSKISVPTALFVGENDTLGDLQDVGTLTNQIGSNPALVFNKVFAKFSHITWFTGTEGAFRSWYPELQGLLKKYNPVPMQALV